MRIKKMMLLIISFLSLNMLYAENYMELIWEQEGEFIEAEYGYSIAAIDFNGDDIDDLVVGSPEWNSSGLPGGTNQGKIYFYFGGTVFDTIPDLTIDGSQNIFHSRYGDHIVNLHDVNGDGYEDLGSIWKDDWQSDIKYFVDIYFGGPDSDTIPDFTHIIYREGVENITSFYPLGDVNGDGYYDAGFIIASTAPVFENSFYIIYGGENPTAELWAEFGNGGGTIREIGNINNDPYDDFIISFHDNEYQGTHVIIFYGNSIVEPVIEDTLYSNTANFWPGGAYAGDFNGDETDDFIGCWSGLGGAALWFGGEEQNPDPSILFEAFGNGNKCFDWGNLNNDNISDIVLGSPLWSNDQGKAYFFIGDENANGSIDLDIPAPIIVGSKFGSTVAVGDFNDDGFDDAAIGAPSPYSSWYPGYVYAYAGNDSLEETSPVSIYEEEIPVVDGIEFNAYPNPFNPSTTIEFSIINDSRVELLVYNIKGQNVKTLANNEFERGNHLIIWNGDDESNKFVSSGVYFYKLTVNGKTRAVKKCMLLK